MENQAPEPDLTKKLPQVPLSFPDPSRPTTRATSIMRVRRWSIYSLVLGIAAGSSMDGLKPI